jgi:hypothetical protein
VLGVLQVANSASKGEQRSRSKRSARGAIAGKHAAPTPANATMSPPHEDATAMATRYYLTLPDAERARGDDDALAFHSHGAEGLAQELQDALRSDSLFQRWRATQDDPEAVDPTLGASDPTAVVRGQQRDLQIDLVATTSLPGPVFKQRLRLLAGSGWKLTDVKSA